MPSESVSACVVFCSSLSSAEQDTRVVDSDATSAIARINFFMVSVILKWSEYFYLIFSLLRLPF